MSWTDAERADALRLADEHSAAEASRRTGIPAATIRSWRHRSGEAGPPSGADPQDWAATKREGAQEAWETAQQALRRVRELLDAGKTADAQRAALTMAILTDKSGVLEIAAEQADERQAAITRQQAETLAAVMRAMLDDLGIPSQPGGSVGKIIARHLREEPVPDSDIEAAKREVRRALDLDRKPDPPDAKLQLEAGPPPEPAGLPAKAEDRKPEPAAGPVKRVRAFRERQDRRRREKQEREEAEVIEGEVVAEEPVGPQAAIHWDDEAWRS